MAIMNKRIQKKVYESDDKYLSWLRDTKGLSQKTLYFYFRNYTMLSQYPDLNQETITDFLQKKKNNGVSRAFVKSFLEFLSTNGIDIEFTFPPKISGKKRQRIINSYTPEEIEILRQGCYDKSKKVGLLFDIIYDGALRRSEIETIKINSFDWDGFFNDMKESGQKKFFGLKVEGKGKKQRAILIRKEIFISVLENLMRQKIINQHMGIEDIRMILKGSDVNLFGNLSEFAVWRIIHNISMKVLKRPVRPHELRHQRATQLEEMGVNIRDLQHYLGHSSPAITEIYLHTQPKTSIRHIAEKLNSL